MINNMFKIVVPVFNSDRWIQGCVESIAMQSHKNFRCVIINDASTDATGERLNDIKTIKEDDRFTIIHNDKNLGALENTIRGYEILNVSEDDNSIMVVVDGDDMLFSEQSLAIVNMAYNQTGCLLSYGNHIHYPTGGRSNCEPIPDEIIQKNLYRDYKFVTSHLRTFKSLLWNKLNPDLHDFKNREGAFYTVGGDVAQMIPLLELAGARILYIDYVLYLYNRANPLSDDIIRQSAQIAVETEVRKKPRYLPIVLN